MSIEGHTTMRILVFLHGTTIMHRNALGRSREERVRQSLEQEESVLDYASYVPIGNAVGKLKKWKEQGAEIFYVSSQESLADVENDKAVLRRYGFPSGNVLFRKRGEEYADIARRIMPDVIIEDDCESIGGEQEMVYPHIRSDLKANIRSIVVKEFGGIDDVPDNYPILECIKPNIWKANWTINGQKSGLE